MAYEYNLRGLFRVRVDQLPLLDQLPHYYQRDLTSSHLYRLGTDLFGKSTIKVRRRLIDASLYFTPPAQRHTAPLNTSLDGRSSARSRETCAKVHYSKGVQMCSRYFAGVDAAKCQYKAWIDQRQKMRMSLNPLGAYKQWLLTKDRSPLEEVMLSKMMSPERESCTSNGILEYDESELENDRLELKSKGPHKKHLLKEIASLEQQYFVSCHHRLVQMLKVTDKACTKHISVNDMLSIFNELKIPLSQAASELLIGILEIDSDGLLKYDQLLSGKILQQAEDYFERFDTELMHENVVQNTCSGDMSTEFQLKEYIAPSSMTGKSGIIADKHVQDELKQFNSLIDYCKENGIMLHRRLAEKALLLPPDHTTKECILGLGRSDVNLLSCRFADPPDTESGSTESKVLNHAGWGQSYKELRGKGKARHIRLSTGKAKVQSKVDCWLTFRDYLKLTEHIRSRPGFTYKVHGLPDSTTFWPRIILDRIRLWWPRETIKDKPYSHYSIFQPVHHQIFYNPHLPSVEQKTSWTDNSGYVQFGSQTRKQYHL